MQPKVWPIICRQVTDYHLVELQLDTLIADPLIASFLILTSEQLKPYLQGQLGPDAVLVDASNVDRVKHILVMAGVLAQLI